MNYESLFVSLLSCFITLRRLVDESFMEPGVYYGHKGWAFKPSSYD